MPGCGDGWLPLETDTPKRARRSFAKVSSNQAGGNQARKGRGSAMKNLTTGADSPLIGAAEIQSPMNWQTALERLDGNDDLLKELAVVFCDECPKLILTLQKATDNKDANAIRAAAHALKGVLSTFSADVASQTAAKLENLAEAGTVTALPTLSAELVAEVEAVFIALRVLSTDRQTANDRSATENTQRDLTYDLKV